MKLDLFNDEASKVWKRVASGKEVTDLLHIELELYKKLLTYFQVGECCYYIFNFQKLEFDFVSREVEQVLGYIPQEISTQFIMEIVHPDDRAWFLACQDCASQFILGLPPEKQMKYKMRFDYRARKKDGSYARIMMQVVVIHTDDSGNVFRTLIVHTDISHLKPHGKPAMSYIGLDGEPSYLNVNVTNPFFRKEEIFSQREKEILILLTKGKTSKEIGDILNITKQTVDTHRKNMFHKAQLSNTNELVSKALKEGWI